MPNPTAGKKPAPPKTDTAAPAASGKDAGIAAPDWERIELDYRAGIKTLRQIADEHGITHGAINKRAKRDGWERDLSGKIQAKADALVSKAAVSSEVSKESKIAEKLVIDANAQAVAEVRLAHRRDIQRARRLTNALLDELEQETDRDTLEQLKKLGELMFEPDEKTGRDRLNELYQAVISLPERSKTMKTLAESLQKLVDMERAAFGMDKDQPREADPLAALLARIATGNGNGFAPVASDPERPSSSLLVRADPADED
ncbi:hypothetical protein [Alicycliphilus denitrificans]|uniref:hypothetical protein n=1 Tax=Alicycliphilus denitrificans TaxID=179636 RepID=UPI0001DA0205|nr:hypothetical protein [Alicycliphilus denitrificans]ADU99431.1 hypothetical protein Alide_1676 [Alicycliphilus denitrificans BC]